MAINIASQSRLKPKNPRAQPIEMGIFVSVEGIDGSGKTTIVNAVASSLTKLGIKVYTTKEPSNSEIGKLIRSWALKKNTSMPHPSIYALLFVADRTMHYMNEVSPALLNNDVVISERYMESTIAYQGALGVSLDWLIQLHRYVPPADLVIILDIDVETAMRRLETRGDLEVFERRTLLNGVRSIFLERARAMGYPVIDASRSAMDVARDVEAIIMRRLSARGAQNER